MIRSLLLSLALLSVVLVAGCSNEQPSQVVKPTPGVVTDTGGGITRSSR